MEFFCQMMSWIQILKQFVTFTLIKKKELNKQQETSILLTATFHNYHVTTSIQNLKFSCLGQILKFGSKKEISYSEVT